MTRGLVLAAALVLGAGCGGDDTSGDDTANDFDAAALDAPGIDADPNAPDAPPAPDAEPSAVVVVDCPANPDATVVTSGFAYDPQTTTIAVGEIVHFMLGGSHNAQSEDGLFTVPFGGDVCLRFDAAGTYGFVCTPHGFTGEIVVQ